MPRNGCQLCHVRFGVRFLSFPGFFMPRNAREYLYVRFAARKESGRAEREPASGGTGQTHYKNPEQNPERSDPDHIQSEDCSDIPSG